MIDLGTTIAPKSDQLNADDLLTGPRTITVTKVSACPDAADQPIAVNFDGDGGKPYKPCKSMRRVLVHVWGRDGHEYVGRRMTIYRDEKVPFGGIAVGGIRISHMSHITAPMTMALAESKKVRKPYTVRPLAAEPKAAPAPATQKAAEPKQAVAEPPRRTVAEWFDALAADLDAAQTGDEVYAIIGREEVQKATGALKNGNLDRLNAMIKAALDRAGDGFPGATDQDAAE